MKIRMIRKHIGYSFIMLLFLIFLLLGLEWLSISVVVLAILHKSMLFLIILVKSLFFKKLLKGSFLFLFIFSIAISIKLFVGDIYKIPSSSMNNTLYTNDVILVNKLKYGPKLPRSPFDIPWVNIAFYLNDKAKAGIGEPWWSYKRLSGTTTIRNGDVLVFTMFKKNMVIVKRCMAIAGDTVNIKNGDVYINNTFFNPSNLILNNYKLTVSNREIFYRKLEAIGLNLSFNKTRTQTNHFGTTLSFQDKTKLEQLGVVDSLLRVTDTLTSKSTVYPNSKYNQWNFDDYGPFIIPKKGMKIKLNPKNYELYSKAINTHEGIKIKHLDGSYFIDDKEASLYIFKQDYYFMMGDNRKGSLDSRVWGIVPEERIIGKVQCVLWSNYQDEFQWNRLFKNID